MSSDSDFDDDDDELLQALIKGNTGLSSNGITLTQTVPGGVLGSQPVIATKAPVTDLESARRRIYQAEGEIAILRAQISQLQNQRQSEVATLVASNEQLARTNTSQVSILRDALEKLEDEKKFLANELKSATTGPKRRKIISQVVSSNGSMSADMPLQLSGQRPQATPTPQGPTTTMLISPNESALLIDRLWSHCIPGSMRTTLEYLAKICLEETITADDLHIPSHTSISHSLTVFFMQKKHLRLDQLIHDICLTLLSLAIKLDEKKIILAVPFLLCLVHSTLTYRPAAVSRVVAEDAIKKLNSIAMSRVLLLETIPREEEYANYQNVTPQAMVLEKYTLICCLDMIEVSSGLACQFGDEIVTTMWAEECLPHRFLSKILPENTERFKDTAQINILYSAVEILISSITPESFAYGLGREASIVSSLMNIFMIEIPLKPGFMFFGLNRLAGNNTDFIKVESTVPLVKDQLNNYVIVTPQPLGQTEQKIEANFAAKLEHERHNLHLRLRTGTFLELYIVTRLLVEFLQNRDHFKLLIRTISSEQDQIFSSPRSQLVHLRTLLIACLIRVVLYLVQETRDLSAMVYPETIYEMFVVLLRIAFGADSLSIEAHKLLQSARQSGWTSAVFDRWCESRAHELNHLNSELTPQDMANAESELANGLEFPYETETVELSREILNAFVTHEEADNVYANMNNLPEHFDEMELLE